MNPKRKRNPRRRNSILVILFAAAALALASCSRRLVYSHFEAVGRQGWSRTDTLCFCVPVKKAGTYSLRLDLRANSIYPYTQLVLAACQQTSRSKASQTEHITFDITNADGDIQGNGTSVYQYHTPLPSVVLAKNDTLTVTLFHGMARDVLPGIIDFGLTVASINVNH